MAVTVTQVRNLIPDIENEYIKDPSIEAVINLGVDIYETVAQCCEIIGTQEKLKEERSYSISTGEGVSFSKQSGDFFLQRARQIRKAGDKNTGDAGFYDIDVVAQNIDRFGIDNTDYVE